MQNGFGWAGKRGPVSVPFADEALDGSVAVEASVFGALVLGADTSAGLVHLFRFDGECGLLDEVEIRAGVEGPSSPNLAVGGGG